MRSLIESSHFKTWRSLLCACLCCFAMGAVSAHATTITIDPDAYAAGTNLSTISPYVTLTTWDGAPVYAAPTYPAKSRSMPSYVTTTGPLGDRVFSTCPDLNSEWAYYGADPHSTTPGGLVISFMQPVTYLSILNADVAGDAGGPAFGDTVSMFAFNSSGALIHPVSRSQVISYNGSMNFGDTVYPVAPVIFHEYECEDICRVVISGVSEITTLDQLSFNTAAPIPEPSTILLLGFGLGAIGLRRIMRRKSA